MAQLRELPLTDLAAVRLDAEVDPRVLRQVRRVCERLRALVALVRFRLAHVHLRVELQVRLAPEDLRTHLALVLSRRMRVRSTEMRVEMRRMRGLHR